MRNAPGGGDQSLPAFQRLLRLEGELDLSRMVECAEMVRHGSIVRFRDLRSRVRQNLSDHVAAAGAMGSRSQRPWALASVRGL